VIDLMANGCNLCGTASASPVVLLGPLALKLTNASSAFRPPAFRLHLLASVRRLFHCSRTASILLLNRLLLPACLRDPSPLGLKLKLIGISLSFAFFLCAVIHELLAFSRGVTLCSASSAPFAAPLNLRDDLFGVAASASRLFLRPCLASS